MNSLNIIWIVELILNSILLVGVAGLVSFSNSPKPGKNAVKYSLFSMGIGYFLFASIFFY